MYKIQGEVDRLNLLPGARLKTSCPRKTLPLTDPQLFIVGVSENSQNFLVGILRVLAEKVLKLIRWKMPGK